MPKEPPRKGKAPENEPSGARDVTSSQIVSTRDIGAAPPAPPPPVRPPRRSTTHGVGWYATEDDEELALPRKGRGKWLFVGVFAVVVLGGGAGVFLWLRGQKAKGAAAGSAADAGVAVVANAVGAGPDAATPRLAHLRLTSTPPGADFVVDGKPLGKSPVTLDAPVKSTLVVEATLPAHQPWRQEVVVAADAPPIEAHLVAVVADAGVAAAAVAPDAAVAPPKKAQPAKSSKSKAKKKAAPTRKPKATTKKRTTR